jgi:hypothetical protein
MDRLLRRLRAALQTAPCAWGCYKQYKNSRWTCVTCGN